MIRILLLFSVSMLLLGGAARAQVPQIPTNIDFATVNVDDITDQQLSQLLQRAQASGYTVNDILQLAQSKGMSADNLSKLKDRLGALPATAPSQGNIPGSNQRNYIRPPMTARDSLQEWKESYRKRIFGSELFSNANLTFEPNLTIPSPAGYILGAGDNLVVNVFGYSERSDKVQVSPDGYVNIPNVGPIMVSGMSLEEARNRIITRLSTVYSGIRSGNTHVQVLLGDIRSIKVMVVGEVVRPGSYTLPSLATLANALYVSGGPDESGSFRNITLVREGAIIDTFDLYRFLATGSLAGNILLRDQDVIKVNPYQKRVILDGQVKHPGIFEAIGGESLQGLIDYAGGYTDKAYTGVIKATRVTDKERAVLTVPQARVAGFALQSGDSVYVDSVLDRFVNRVIVKGPVFFPGSYALQPGMTVKDLITLAGGLKEDIFLNRALIRRRAADYSQEIVAFNVGDVLSGAAVQPLKAEDSVILYSKFDLREHYYIYVKGEVNRPDSIPYSDGMHLEDAILLSGGFKDAASRKEISVARRARSQEYNSADISMAVVRKFTVPENFAEPTDSSASFELQPFDVIIVHRSPGYKEQGLARVDGEVIYPGEYVIDSKSEKLTDLIAKAGGLKTDAYAEGAQLLRLKDFEGSGKYFEQNKLDVFREANKGNDSLEIAKIKGNMDTAYQLVDINLDKALQAPGSKYDLLVEKGDVVRVPLRLETVSLNGEVFYPKEVRFDRKYRFKDFIYQAGGFTSEALRRGSYVVYPNGEVASTKGFLFMHRYPRVKPGSDIYVPARKKRAAASPAEIVGLAGGIVAILGIFISIINISK
jgi:protein involved in polysaccharide export with SLBB domain